MLVVTAGSIILFIIYRWIGLIKSLRLDTVLVNAKPGFKLSSSSLQSVHSFYYSSPSLKPWLKSKPHHLLALRPWASDWTLLRTSFLICKLKDGTYLTNVLWWLTEMTLQVLSAEQVISICSFSLPFHWGVNQWPGRIRIFLPADYTCSNFSGTWLTRGRKLQMVLNKNETATRKKKSHHGLVQWMQKMTNPSKSWHLITQMHFHPAFGSNWPKSGKYWFRSKRRVSFRNYETHDVLIVVGKKLKASWKWTDSCAEGSPPSNSEVSSWCNELLGQSVHP